MGKAYVSGIHWTSRLRRKAGLMPYENRDKTQSTFTIDDISGSFTDYSIEKDTKRRAHGDGISIITLKLSHPRLGFSHHSA